MKVQMVPHVRSVIQGESGIHTLIRKYFEFLPTYGIELVEPDNSDFDLLAVHAGMASVYPESAPLVAHIHGLYWTADLATQGWQHRANKHVVDSIRYATTITVPSYWVAKTLQNDMHINPFVLEHGIDVEEWSTSGETKYVLWNKNRDTDVCDPSNVNALAILHRDTKFMSTFSKSSPTPNIMTTGVVPHAKMREMVENCSVYLSTTKETFGIGILEAMASGKPILGFKQGGITSLVQHGVNGYLAAPGDLDDLSNGLSYCLEHQKTLGENGREMAKFWTWERVAGQINTVYQYAIDNYSQPHDVTVIIPCYNMSGSIERAVVSAASQALMPTQIIFVDNNSTDDSYAIAKKLRDKSPELITLLKESRQGVAYARNAGLYYARTRYVCCLDADDEILPEFLSVCVEELEADPSLGMAFTKLEVVNEQGELHYPQWPETYDFQRTLRRQNPVPTCCVFKREAAIRLGGFRQRYAPDGAGAEDAEFWLRMGSIGLKGKLVTEKALFRYHLGGAVGSNPDYHEVDWLKWHPWAHDRLYPFASVARPVNNTSHVVRQYDEPDVSVVIPCSVDHLDIVIDALDSVKAQTFRSTQTILIVDGIDRNDERIQKLLLAYPYAIIDTLPESRGAGYCRNWGALKASGSLLLFLDADDWLDPFCVEELYNAYLVDHEIAYSDYYGYAVIDVAMADTLRRDKRLESFDPGTGDAVIRHYAAEYDCTRAQRQPELNHGQFYIWNLVTSLVPKKIHFDVGGFDEQMDSWEDWDYWVRIARRGECFVRVAKPLVNYRFTTGSRREIGRQEHESLLDYMKEKYEKEPLMACTGCGGRRKAPTAPIQASGPREQMNMAEGDVVTVQLVDGNIGEHPIRIRDHGENRLYDYGYRKNGDKFLVRRDHAKLYPRKFLIIDQPQPASAAPPQEEPVSELPPPKPVVKEDDLTIIGLSKSQVDELHLLGINTFQDVVESDEGDLQRVNGVGPATSRKIIKNAKKQL